MLKQLLLSALLSCTPLLMAQDSAIVRKVDDHYNHLNSLSARYTEHYAGMGMDRTESGALLLKKPGRMRWTYDQPSGKVFILDGKFAWFYTPGDPQAQRIPAKQLDDLRSPLRFLLGHTQLAKELDNLTVTPDGASFRITGIPKGMEQRLKLLTLTVTPPEPSRPCVSRRLTEPSPSSPSPPCRRTSPSKTATSLFIPPAGVTVINGLPPI